MLLADRLERAVDAVLRVVQLDGREHDGTRAACAAAEIEIATLRDLLEATKRDAQSRVRPDRASWIEDRPSVH